MIAHMNSQIYSKLKQFFIYITTNYDWVFGIIISITLISSIYSITYIKSIETDFTLLYENDVKGQDYVQNANTTLQNIKSKVKDLIISGDPNTKEIDLNEIEKTIKLMRLMVNKATPTFYTKSGKQSINRSKKDMTLFVNSLESELDRDEINITNGSEIISNIEDQSNRLSSDLQRLSEIKKNSIYLTFKKVRAQLEISLASTIFILVFSIIMRISIYINGRKKLSGTPPNKVV
jgi:hypothetical protein